jgi:hypothetical protein
MFFRSGPVGTEVIQKNIPVGFQMMNLEIAQRKGKGVINSPQSGDTILQEFSEPVGKLPA